MGTHKKTGGGQGGSLRPIFSKVVYAHEQGDMPYGGVLV